MATTAGAAAMVELVAQVRGDVLTADDGRYEDARKLYNAMIDKRPQVIVRCVDVADVIAAVLHGREAGLDLAIRSGGHNGPGLSSVDDGLVIDLGRMRGVEVDPEARTARVQGGAQLGDVDHATHVFGLAVPAGIISTTGVGGLTLGGGVGNLTRSFGLTVDSLVGADVVLADGSFVTTDEDHHSDLLWSLRGGGGNFGVVTSFTFKLHPVKNVFAGPMLWTLDRMPEVLSWYRDYILAAPDELNGWFGVLTVPPVAPFPEELQLQKVCAVLWCSTAPEAHTAELLAPARAFRPALDGVGELPLPVIQAAFDGIYPKGDQWYWRTDFVREISDDAIALHHEHASRMPTPQSTMHLYPVDGAASRVGKDETAWSYRDANWIQVMVGVDGDPGNAGVITRWAKDYWEALHPHSMQSGGYVNMMMDEGDDRVRASYRENYARLASAKAQYDPGNVFHVNQNIRPASRT
jgi:FAD/FMN-containing dehydrogenase